jgi:ACS family hexuronate transporter-like MFS transporter
MAKALHPPIRYLIAGILFIETLLAYLDMQELAVLAPLLRKAIGVGNSEYALITQAFLAAYTVTFLLGGLVIDRLGVRRGLALALTWWSVASALHALANTPGQLAICRLLLGIAYPAAFLAAARAVSEWYPPQERGFVYGLYVSGASFGAIVAYPLVTWMSLVWSWRAPFLLTGAAGIALVGLWLLVYYSPEAHPWVTAEERDYVMCNRPPVENSTGSPIATLVRSRVFWAVGLGRFVADNTWMFYALWLSKFLAEGSGLPMATVGKVGWIPFLFADIGGMLGGWCSGRLIRRGWAPRYSRMAVLFAVTVVRSFTFVLAFHYSLPWLIGLLSVLMMCTTAWQTNLSVMLVDTFPSRVIATAAGLTTSFGTLSSVFFTRGVASIVERHSYRPVFVLISILTVAGFAVVLGVLGHKELTMRPAVSLESAELKPTVSA